jgi:glycosyltransferase involved in cell wall biosynthesis
MRVPRLPPRVIFGIRMPSEVPSRPLRILQVTPYFEGAWAYGGIPRVVGALSRGLARAGHHVTVCTTDVFDAGSRLTQPVNHATSRGPWSAMRPAERLEIRVFPNLSNRLAYGLQLFMPLGMRRYLRESAGSFDVAHLHGCRHLPGVLAARYGPRAGVPYVVSPHGTAPLLERRQALKWVFDHTIGGGVMPGAARVLALTRAEARQLDALAVPPASVRLIPNPIDLSQFEPRIAAGAFRQNFGLGAAPVILFLGKLTPRKRVDVLIRALARMRRPDMRLVIAGNDMGVQRELATLVRDLNLQAQTLFTGLLSGNARLEALTDADVVVYPSRDEIFGLVPIEAILCGTPVVVSNDSGCGEVVAGVGGGLLVDGADPAAVGAAISKILAQPEHWRREARDAQPRISDAYSPDAVCGRLVDVYRELAAGGFTATRERRP